MACRGRQRRVKWLWWLLPGWALVAQAAWSETWLTVGQGADELVAVDIATLRREAGQVWFREKRVVRRERLAAGSLRPIRELQLKRVADCAAGRLATLSVSVFSDGDALIDYQAWHPRQAQWNAAGTEREIFEAVCAHSPARRD